MLIFLIQLNLFPIDRNVGIINDRPNPLCYASVRIAVGEVKRLKQSRYRPGVAQRVPGS